MKKYETLEELKDAIAAGEIDESKMEVWMDNDCSHIYYYPNGQPADEEDDDADDITIFEGHGYNDTEILWPLVFPKAMVSWV